LASLKDLALHLFGAKFLAVPTMLARQDPCVLDSKPNAFLFVLAKIGPLF
jgi:hypothetical protein